VIQVIYRWRVPVENKDAFLTAWAATTRVIRETTQDARGSFCIVGIDDPTEIVIIARWDGLDQWRAFVPTAVSATMKDMQRLGTLLSHAAYEQAGDLTV
jgi:heme-degrading monooxygenase HmoA